MKVWVLVVNAKVDSLYKTSKSAMERVRILKEVNGSQLGVYLQEMEVHE